MIFYFDTSALIKLVISEQGSELAAALWESPEPAVSTILSYPEGRAALAAALRNGRIDKKTYADSLARFETLHEELIAIGVDERLAHTAGDHAAGLGLRGYDAVHLASTLDLGEAEVVIVTWDQDLARAAESAGLAVAGIMSR